MAKIILMNMGTEHALGYDSASSHPVAKSVWRHVWFAEKGDIIVSPVALEAGFLRYIGDTLGFDPSSVAIIVRDQLLTDEMILSVEMVDDLRLRMAGSGPWAIMPCFWTEGVAELASLLGVGAPIGLNLAAQRGYDLFNRKTHFRQLAAGAHLPIANGSIVHTPQSLAEAIEKHLPCTGIVIVKQDNGAGGMGNITLTRGAVMPLPGSRETRYAPEEVHDVADELWAQLTDRWRQVLVVESYHKASHRFYFEYLIDDTGCPRFLNSGTIRLRSDNDPSVKELVWIGLDIPAELPLFSCANALSMSMQFTVLAAQIGYRGHINIDAIITDTGEILFNEVNGRWGGGLVLHVIGERLLGRQYADNHAVSSQRDVPSVPRAEAVRLLRDCGLHFNPQLNEGVIVLACDEYVAGTMECVLIGHSRSRVAQIEGMLLEVMEEYEREAGQ